MNGYSASLDKVKNYANDLGLYAFFTKNGDLIVKKTQTYVIESNLEFFEEENKTYIQKDELLKIIEKIGYR